VRRDRAGERGGLDRDRENKGVDRVAKTFLCLFNNCK
jgi:hypothetical protein